MAAMTSGSKFNSGKFPDIQKSIEHSKDNPLTMTNISYRLNYKGRFIMNEPHNVLFQYKHFIMSNLIEITLPPNRKFRPESIAELYYGTPDLWYIIMLANGITRPEQLSGNKVKLLRVEMLNSLIKLIQKNSSDIKKNHKNPHKINNRTLKNID